jgi:hypothetical protein
MMLFTTTFASSNVIDVQFKELVKENVLYNPLKVGGGLWHDANENQSLYNLTGLLIVKNTNTEPVQDIVLNISNVNNIYNITNITGAGFVTLDTTNNYMVVTIPDLGPGQNVTFAYNINKTIIAPALNFTTKYDKIKLFSGTSLKVNDFVSNDLNSSLYPNNCIYNIKVIENALTLNDSGNLVNVTYDPTTLSGADSGNATIDSTNRTLTWNLFGGNCFYSGNNTNINYSVNVPTVSLADNYKIINATIYYDLNTTISRLKLNNIDAVANLGVKFDKNLNETLEGDNATWKITSYVLSNSNITVNLTQVTLWVSVRNATGTGFTNPSKIDNDTITGNELLKEYYPNVLMNLTNSMWNNSGVEWFFNYTFSSSPIVWMDIKDHIVNDGVQLTNRSITYGNNTIYVKEIYLVTGYWLEISKNITRLDNNSYSIFIKVKNIGNQPTPSGQIVQVYNFLPNTFNLTSSFVFSNSTWYNTQSANETLNDPKYNGTMYQFGIIADNNPYNASLDKWGGSENLNNTWTVTYNITGKGKFNYEDLFLTGVDPLHVDEYGATKALIMNGIYDVINSGMSVALGASALVLAVLLFLF